MVDLLRSSANRPRKKFQGLLHLVPVRVPPWGAAAILTDGVGSSGAVETVRVGVHPVKTRTPALTEIGIAYRERVTNIRLTANPFPVFPVVTL
jgi:hypothetical protein